MKPGIFAILLFLVPVTPELRYFHFERPVQDAGTQAEQTCVVVDAGIYAHAAPGLADLRLYRDGTETPYAIRDDQPGEAGRKALTPLNVGTREGKTVFDAEAPDGPYSDVELDIRGKDFISTVAVWGSHSQTEGEGTALGSFTVFDLTGQKLGRSTVLHLPQSNFRFLHFSVSAPLKPESILGLSVERLPAGGPKYLTVAESTQAAQQGRVSTFEFTVPAHVPVDRIAFAPGAQPAFFNREVSVRVVAVDPKASEGVPDRAITATGNLLRVHKVEDGHKIDEERLTMDAPWSDFSTAAKWTVTVDNGDDAPLALERVRLQMRERKLCFKPVSGAHYTLYYGDPALAAPHYDYGTVSLAQPDAAEPALGAERENASYHPRPDERPFTERHPALLWLALIAVVALLGGIALRSAKPAG